MSLFKRISATLVSRMDQVVGEIENHDAVVQATINEQRKRVAQAKVRLSQIQRDAARLNDQLQEQQTAERRWKLRALAAAKQDETKALECIRRRHHCQHQIKRLSTSLGQYQQTATKLARDINHSEERLNEMTQKHNLMRARQSSTEALNAVAQTIGDSAQQMDDAFDRWEMLITQQEMVRGESEFIDPLEQEFTLQENEEELRDELDSLLREEADDDR